MEKLFEPAQRTNHMGNAGRSYWNRRNTAGGSKTRAVWGVRCRRLWHRTDLRLSCLGWDTCMVPTALYFMRWFGDFPTFQKVKWRSKRRLPRCLTIWHILQLHLCCFSFCWIVNHNSCSQENIQKGNLAKASDEVISSGAFVHVHQEHSCKFCTKRSEKPA